MVSIRQPGAQGGGLMPSWLPGINKAFFNRVQGLWAPYVPPYAVIVHKGRNTGTEYRTPVTAFRSGSRIAVPLAYGERTDWVRNLLAAERGGVERLGRLHRLTEPRVVSDPAELPAPLRPLTRYMKFLVADIEEEGRLRRRAVTARDGSGSGRSLR
jgi:deazaflavin-dependent oxidoreductase (nitroreductase family)